MGKREKIGCEIMDDHSPAQIVVKACTFIASLLSCVAEKPSLT